MLERLGASALRGIVGNPRAWRAVMEIPSLSGSAPDFESTDEAFRMDYLEMMLLVDMGDARRHVAEVAARLERGDFELH